MIAWTVSGSRSCVVIGQADLAPALWFPPHVHIQATMYGLIDGKVDGADEWMDKRGSVSNDESVL